MTDVTAWCAAHLGAAPVATLFRSGNLSAVYGLRLTDGREVVVKVRPAADRLRGCVEVQRWFHSAGFPCPRPLAGPAPLGSQAATAEEHVPGGSATPHTRAGGRRHARLLARLVADGPPPDDVPDLAPAPPWFYAGRADAAGPWPPADDRPDDLNASSAVPWLDDIARRLRDAWPRLTAGLPDVVGHGDFEAHNLRWRGSEPLAVHDWDSVVRAPEAAIVGHTAATWPLGSSSSGATVAETVAFLADYRPRWTHSELRLGWAAGLWALAFNAKKSSLDGNLRRLDRAEAAERLRRAGLA